MKIHRGDILSPLCIFYPAMERCFAVHILCAVFLCGCLNSSRSLNMEQNSRRQDRSIDAAVRELVMESDVEEAALMELAEKKNEEIQSENSSGI